MSQPMQELSKSQLESVSSFAAVLAAGAGRIFSETTAFVELAGRNNSAWLRDIVKVKSPPELFQVQMDAAKAQFTALFGQARKIGAIYSEMTEDALKVAPRPQPAATSAPSGAEKIAA